MEHEASFKNKTGSNALASHSRTTRNIPGGLAFAIIFRIPHIPLRNDLNRSDCWYPVHRTERKTNHLLYMD